MVRAYHPCGASPYSSVDDYETEAGTNACKPVFPIELGGESTTYAFSEKGGCSIQTKVKIVASCETLTNSAGEPLNLPAGSCHVTYVRARCKGVVRSDGITPVRGALDDGWTLIVTSRASIDDANGDVTMIDVPMLFEFSIPEDGRFEVDSTSAEALLDMLGAADAALPPCTSMEITDVKIRDPNGNHFASIGHATAPR